MNEVSKLALEVNNLLLSVLYQTAYYDSFLLTLLSFLCCLKASLFYVQKKITTFIILVIIIIAVVADTEKKIFHIMDSVDAK
jgi:hypothetical protein